MFITEQQMDEQMRLAGFNTGSTPDWPLGNPLPIGSNMKPTADPLAHAVRFKYASGKLMDTDILEVMRFVSNKNKDEPHRVVMLA